MQAPSIASALQSAIDELALTHDNARLDAEVLLASALGQSRSYLRAWPERQLTEQQLLLFSGLIRRRLDGEPIAHILGRREFWSLELEVTPDTLIPRPETELLVEQTLALIPPDAALQIADLGTGSGAIALAIAHERPRCRITAVDRSKAALQVAERNAVRHKLPNIVLRHSYWFSELTARRFDIIVSNPPYIRADDPHLTQGDVRFEASSALVSGTDGLDDLRCIISAAPRHLQAGGWLLVEHGYDQGSAVRDLFAAACFTAIHSTRDLAGQERITCGRITAPGD